MAFVSVGDAARHTGGYLYHAEVFRRLRERGVAIIEVNAGTADVAAQRAGQAALGAAFDPMRYDVIVVDALACVVCAPWLDAWRAACPLVAMVHELPSVAGSGAPADEAALLRADRVIAVSQHGRTILEARDVPLERVLVVSPGCDRVPLIGNQGAGIRDQELEGDRETRSQGETEPAIPHPPSPIPHPLRVLCVAQWIPRKGILELVHAWREQLGFAAVLELVGETSADPAYAAVVHAAIQAAPPHAPIIVHGVLDDHALAAAYQRAAVFALPSRYEGYGMVYAEALLHGLPIIACAVGPVPVLVGAAGLLVPPDDSAALGAALGRLLRDEPLRAQLRAAAHAQAAHLPTWEDTACGFAAALRAAADERPSTGAC